MAVKVKAIADAVAAALTAAVGDFDLAFTAESVHRFEIESSELPEGVLVKVVPVGRSDYQIQSRDTFGWLASVDVHVIRKLGAVADETTEMDATAALTEAIGDFLTDRDMAGVAWFQNEEESLYDREEVEIARVYWARIRVGYRVFNTVP